MAVSRCLHGNGPWPMTNLRSSSGVVWECATWPLVQKELYTKVAIIMYQKDGIAEFTHLELVRFGFPWNCRFGIFYFYFYFIFFWFGWSHKWDKVVKSYVSSFLVTILSWLDYCNRDCSLPPHSVRWWWPGGGTPLSPLLSYFSGLLMAPMVRDFAGLQQLQPLTSNAAFANRAAWIILTPAMASWAWMYCTDTLPQQDISRMA